jgi:Cysteine-rich CPCC
MAETAGFPCPCCGYRTLPGRSPTDEICPVCFWQDDFVDNKDTDVLGPNQVTLSVARENFRRFGASEERWAARVRPPRPSEGPPEPWTARG